MLFRSWGKGVSLGSVEVEEAGGMRRLQESRGRMEARGERREAEGGWGKLGESSGRMEVDEV